MPPVGTTNPDFRDIKPADLSDTGRALALHAQAVARGLVTASERDVVRFLAAVEHARAVGKANPCGLLAWIIRDGLWRVITQADEDRAARRLREHRRPGSPGPAPTSTRPRSMPAPASMMPMPFRSPYAQERPARGPSDLGSLLARLAIGATP